jgi:hypothetical protein
MVFPFGSQILQMSSCSESILDHIADYLKFISGTQSFWFTLNTSYKHDCHLASRFRLEPIVYEVFSSSPASHCIHNWALLSSPRLGESSLVGIDLQPTIALLSWNKKRLTSMHTSMGQSHGTADDDADNNADVNADDDTATQQMDEGVDNDAACRQ